MEALNLPIRVDGAEMIALLDRFAASIENTGKKSEEASQKTGSAFDRMKSSAHEAAAAFGEMRAAADRDLDEMATAVSGVADSVSGALGSIMSFAQSVNAAVDRIAELSSEQERLSTQSARLGVDFDQAAAAAGRFADETEAMTAATRLAEAGIGVTQEQLDALMRTAGAFSQATGTTTAAAVDQLTQGLLAGSERGLRPFGADMAAMAGDAHTAGERLQALVQHAEHVTPAVDSASDAVARFKDQLEDAQRTMATGFTEELRRIDEESRRRLGPEGAAGSAEDLNTALRTIGQTAAGTFMVVYRWVDLVTEALAAQVSTVGTLASSFAEFTRNPLAAAAIIARAREGITADVADVQASFRRLNATAGAVYGDRTSATANDNANPDAPARPFNRGVLGNETEGGRDGSREGDFQGYQRDAGRGGRGGGRAASPHLSSASVDSLIARATAAADDRWTQRMDDLDAAMNRAARDSGAAGQSLGQQIRGATHVNEREAQQLGTREDLVLAERETARMQRELEQRANAEQSYTDHMRDMHAERASAAQSEAEAVTMGFNAMGGALAKHLQLWAAGKEGFADAAQAMAADTLSSVGQQAIVKGAMEMAEGLSMLAGIYTAPLAPGHFAAGAAFLAVGALATAGGAALAPTPAAPSAGGGGGARPSRGETFGNDRPREPKGGDGITVIHMYYGPTINGRGTSESEAGARVLRLTDATARRQQRARE